MNGGSRVYVLPTLGDTEVETLTTSQLTRWLAGAAATPPRNKPNYDADDFEMARKRRATANRVAKMLRAAFNFAFNEGRVARNDAWGRRWKLFSGVDVPRSRYLTLDECVRFLNGCLVEFRPLARAALETGARYGELTRLRVHDFNPDVGTIQIRKSKSSKVRYIPLTGEGAQFFESVTAGRPGNALMFTRADGRPWGAGAQGYFVKAACEAASIQPPICFHSLRHTYASLSVMGGVPLFVVAKTLGHRDARMCELHYAHLSADYLTDVVRSSAPRYGTVHASNVKPIRFKKN